MLRKNSCPVCGGDLEELSSGRFRCTYCGKTFTDDMASLKNLINGIILENTARAKRNLWDAMHEKNIDSAKCLGFAFNLLNLDDTNFYAKFAVAANSKDSDEQICKTLGSATKADTDLYADAVLDFAIESLTPKTCSAVSFFIERAYKEGSKEYVKYINLYEDAEKNINSGIFDVTLLRDVFLAYSSKDREKVVELRDYLEKQGITCFDAARNLRHGAFAVQNYQNAIYAAMESCNTVVFVSSKNSRNGSCDAYSVELAYMFRKDMENMPPVYKYRPYNTIPYDYKKNRIEYLVDEYGEETIYDKQIKIMFSGLSWTRDKETVAIRVDGYKTQRVNSMPKPNKTSPMLPGGGDAGEAQRVRYHEIPSELERWLPRKEIRSGIQLERYASYGTRAIDIYDAGCQAFGWKTSNRGNFGPQRSLYAAHTTPEDFSVWLLYHNDIIHKGAEFDGREKLNFIRNKEIVEVDKVARARGITPIPDEYRLTFVKTNTSGYVYCGVFRLSFVYTDAATGELTRVFTRLPEYDEYPS